MKKLKQHFKRTVKEGNDMESKDFGKMIRTITSNTNNYIGAKIEKYGIKHGQFEYFLFIYSSPGINQIELAKLKSVGKASVTKALKILEDEGFIRRVPDEQDRRNTLCYITEKGDIIANDLLQIKAEAEKILFEGFTKEGKEDLYKHLFLLHQNSDALVANIEIKIGVD